MEIKIINNGTPNFQMLVYEFPAPICSSYIMQEPLEAPTFTKYLQAIPWPLAKIVIH